MANVWKIDSEAVNKIKINKKWTVKEMIETKNEKTCETDALQSCSLNGFELVQVKTIVWDCFRFTFLLKVTFYSILSMFYLDSYKSYTYSNLHLYRIFNSKQSPFKFDKTKIIYFRCFVCLYAFASISSFSRVLSLSFPF